MLDCRPGAPPPVTGIFSILLRVHAVTEPQKLRKRDTFMFFRGDIKLWVLEDLVQTGSCLLQTLFNHFCDKPLRGKEKVLYVLQR